MVYYSHSKLDTFEQCRLKYKYRYIDKIVPEIPKTIEAHFGIVIHKTLEWFYNKIMEGTIPSINDLIFYYSDTWGEEYDPNIEIIDKSQTLEGYFNRGVEFLTSYYTKNFPFKDNTIGTEEKIEISLGETGEIKLVGYVDRLVHNLEKDEIEIHDYKTTNSVLMKEKIENSRQLALYSIGIKEIFGREKNVSMVWHFLAHDVKFSSRKTNEELEELKKEVVELIKRIESTTDFPANVSRLCDWCDFRNICTARNSKRM